MGHFASQALRVAPRDRVLHFAVGAQADDVPLSALGGHVELYAIDSWETFLRALPDAACAVLRVPELRDPETMDRLTESEERHPLVPRVLVTGRGSSNLSCLGEITAERVVLTDDTPEHVAAAAHGALTSTVTRRLDRAVGRLAQLDPRLRSALMSACTAKPAIHTVAALAKRAGIGRSTLAEQWARVVDGSRRHWRLQDCLHDMELIHALEARARGVPVRTLPGTVGVSAKTLARRRKSAGIPPEWLDCPATCRRSAHAAAQRILQALTNGRSECVGQNVRKSGDSVNCHQGLST